MRPMKSPSRVAQEEVSADARQFSQSQETLAKARRLLAQAPQDDADEMRSLINQLAQAIAAGQSEPVRQISERLDDLIFYLQDT